MPVSGRPMNFALLKTTSGVPVAGSAACQNAFTSVDTLDAGRPEFEMRPTQNAIAASASAAPTRIHGELHRKRAAVSCVAGVSRLAGTMGARTASAVGPAGAVLENNSEC